MAKFLAMQVRLGKLAPEQVPNRYRQAVAALLNGEGLE